MWCSEIYDRHLTSVGRIHARIQRRDRGLDPSPPPPPEKSYIGFLSNTGWDPLKNYKATKPAMLGHHWHASETPGSPCLYVCKTSL